MAHLPPSMALPSVFARLVRFLAKPVALVMCVLAMTVAGQVCAVDLGRDMAVAAVFAHAAADVDGCGAPSDLRDAGKAGHCAACCVHHVSAQVPQAAAAVPVQFASAALRAARAQPLSSMPPSLLPDPPRA